MDDKQFTEYLNGKYKYFDIRNIKTIIVNNKYATKSQLIDTMKILKTMDNSACHIEVINRELRRRMIT